MLNMQDNWVVIFKFPDGVTGALGFAKEDEAKKKYQHYLDRKMKFVILAEVKNRSADELIHRFRKKG